MFDRWLTFPKQSGLLLGPRRAGKTTLLRRRFPNYRYVTLDDFDFLTYAQRDPKGLMIELGPTCIIDEVQRVPQLTVAVKHVLDRGGAHIWMTGSSSMGLLDSSADSLAGRVDIHHLPAACFGEENYPAQASFLGTKLPPLRLMQAQRALEDALRYGGFPEVVSCASSEEKRRILKRYRDTYFTRDLAQLSNIENIEGLLAILMHVGRSIGSQLEVSSFARESGLSYPTAKKYINVLTQSDLAFKLYGYQHGPAKRYLKASKLYFADNGILTALGQSLSPGPRFENFVISEVEKRRKLGFLQSDALYYYKSAGGLEIDLLWEEEEVLHALEIKCSPSVNPHDVRTLRRFSEQHPEKKTKLYLVYAGQEYKEIDGVRCVPAAALYGMK